MFQRTSTSAGLLLLRLAVGGIFIAHGAQKLFVIGLPGVQQMFEGMGLPAPAILAPVVALVELVGGLLLMLGLGTRVAGVALAIVSVGALVTAHLPAGFFAQDGGIEFTLLLAVASLVPALTGAGAFSVDAVIASRRGRTSRAPRAATA